MSTDRRYGMRIATELHKFWYRATNGLVGSNMFGAKVLLLATTGRKSGRRFTTPLTYYEEGDKIVLIASNAGAETDPNWWRNLKAQPNATVQIGRTHKDVVAEAAVGAERDRLWAAVTARYPTYLSYATKTSRAIPVVVLRPRIDPA